MDQGTEAIRVTDLHKRFGRLEVLKGVSLSADGYTLGPVTAPAVPNVAGNVDFTVLDRRGEPVREFDVAHEKQLHLIAVRADGAHRSPEPPDVRAIPTLPRLRRLARTRRPGA